MKLRIGKRKIDRDADFESIRVLVVRTDSADELKLRVAADENSDGLPVLSMEVPFPWAQAMFDRIFAGDGPPIDLGDVLDDASERGAVARADAVFGAGQASADAFLAGVSRRLDLRTSAVSFLDEILRARLPEFVAKAFESAVQAARDAEEKIAGMPLPSRGPVPLRRKRGGERGDSVEYYIRTRARHLRTGESLLNIFAESSSESRVKARYRS